MGLRSVGVLVLGIVVLVMASACLNQPMRTNTPTSPSTSSLTTSHRERGDVNPPEILDFNWTPTKVVWDKVYDIEVNFTVEDDKTPIKYAELHFIPVEYKYFITKYGMRPEDYPKVFPPDKERVYVLKPIDGKFDELKEEFSVDIKDITGGREYKIVAVVKDAAGNEKTIEVKAPYIRQFPNLGMFLYEGGRLTPEELRIIGKTPGYEEFLKLAEEGKTLKFEGGIIVAIQAQSAYDTDWEYVEPMVIHPLLGRYKLADPIVVAKHIDWATGYGINCFFYVWGFDDEKANKINHENLIKILSYPMTSQIKIAINYDISRLTVAGICPNEYGQYNVSDNSKWEKIIQDFKIISKDLFSKPNYLKLDSRPVVYFYGSDALVGDVDKFINALREVNRVGIFFISDHAHPWAAKWVYESLNEGNVPTYIKHGLAFDAWSTWAAGWYSPVKEPKEVNFPIWLDQRYYLWKEISKHFNRYFIPSLIPGFVELRDSEWIENNMNLPRNVEMYKNELEVGYKYNKNFMFVGTWNIAGEGTELEPSLEEGFTFLKILKGFLMQKFTSV